MAYRPGRPSGRRPMMPTTRIGFDVSRPWRSSCRANVSGSVSTSIKRPISFGSGIRSTPAIRKSLGSKASTDASGAGAAEKSWAFSARGGSFPQHRETRMAHGIRVMIAAVALSVSTAGCIATEAWTQDVLGKRQAEIDDRFVKVETGAREQGERLDRVEVRVDKVENRIADLDHRGPRKVAAERPASTGSVVVRSTSQRTLV